MLAFFSGVPEILVPDNVKSGVNKARYYGSDLNLSYQQLAEHYRVAVIPARHRRTIQIRPPLLFVADMTQTRLSTGICLRGAR